MIDWNALVVGPTVGIFGESVTYIVGDISFCITGVFDQAFIELTPLGRGSMVDTEVFGLGGAASITTQTPVLGVQLSQFPRAHQPAQGDVVKIRGGMYSVKEVRLDSHGGATLLLNQWRPPQC